MSGPAKGNTVFIPRIIFYAEDDDNEFPFKLKRKEFPVVPAFVMTSTRHKVSKAMTLTSTVTSQKAIKITVGPEMINVDGR
ncbi:Helitron helicase, partial [Phytophthora megakarya]